jgi:hypothetical protein
MLPRERHQRCLLPPRRDESMSSEPVVPRPDPAPWLPLLRRLTQLSTTWCAWKNVDRALAGYGDIDSVSLLEDCDRLLNEFRAWASTHGMGPIFICSHLPGSVLGVAVRHREELIELQLCQQAFFRGSVLFGTRDLVPLMEMDERGFRRLRPGAEGLLLLFFNSLKRGGRPHFGNEKARHPLDLLRRDPEGAELATRLFGPVQRQAFRVAKAALEGRWDYGSAIRIELWAAGRSFLDPRMLTARVKLRAARLKLCPLLPALNQGRRLSGDVDEWLVEAARSHPNAAS